jgi:hypothetical protein
MNKRSFRRETAESDRPRYPTLERFDGFERRAFLALLGASALGSLVGCETGTDGVPPRMPSKLDLSSKDLEISAPEAMIGLPDADPARLDQRIRPAEAGPHRSVRLGPPPRSPITRAEPPKDIGGLVDGGGKPDLSGAALDLQDH